MSESKEEYQLKLLKIIEDGSAKTFVYKDPDKKEDIWDKVRARILKTDKNTRLDK